MYYKIIFNILSMIGLIILQVSFIGNLPGITGGMNPVVIALIFLSGPERLRLSLWWAASIGFLLDIYSFGTFGSYMLILAAIAVLIDFLQNNFFTNRSLYSFLALAFFACLGYDLGVIFWGGLGGFIGSRSFFPAGAGADFLLAESGRLFVNLLAVALVFYALHFAGAKLRPMQLLRHK